MGGYQMINRVEEALSLLELLVIVESFDAKNSNTYILKAIFLLREYLILNGTGLKLPKGIMEYAKKKEEKT
jgi:hypothetical protein